MHNIFTQLRLWLTAFTARPAPQSPLDTMSACELADLPASHPQC